MVKSDNEADLKRGLSMEPQGTHFGFPCEAPSFMTSKCSKAPSRDPCCNVDLGRWNSLDYHPLQAIKVQLTHIPKEICVSAQIRSKTPWNWHRKRVAWPASNETSWTLKTDRKGRSTSWVTEKRWKVTSMEASCVGIQHIYHMLYIIYDITYMT